MFQAFNRAPHAHGNLYIFAILFFLIQLFLMFMFGFYVRYQTTDMVAGYLEGYYPWWQDINVMILIGFGFLMSFIRSKAWSALGFTFFINAIVFQMYILWEGYWHKAFHGFVAGDRWIYMNATTLIKASFCVASVLIAFGTMIGRITPLMLLILGTVMTIGYSFNELLIFGGGITVFDIGGSMNIHLFGATAGLVCSFIIGRRAPVGQRQPTPSYSSCIFAMIGTLFLWLYWPSFNSGLLSSALVFQRMAIIHNTVLALTGSCIATFIFSIIFRGRLHMDDVLNATIAGGVAIGSSASILFNPGGAIAIGFIAGMLSTIGYYFLLSKINACGIYDTCGVFNLHFMPGLFGGLVSAVVMASYNSVALAPLIGGNTVDFEGVNYLKQGGLQVAGTFISLGIGAVTGAIAAFLMSLVYKMRNDMFFEDIHYWDIHHHGPHPYDDSELMAKNADILPPQPQAVPVNSSIQMMQPAV